tara:strand:- start:853 stop:1098 length:246 start_codon:yes stop_codon:yes gene_type:complete
MTKMSEINNKVSAEIRSNEDSYYDGHISDGCDVCTYDEGLKVIDQEVYYIQDDNGRLAIDVQRTMDEFENRLSNLNPSGIR